MPLSQFVPLDAYFIHPKHCHGCVACSLPIGIHLLAPETFFMPQCENQPTFDNYDSNSKMTGQVSALCQSIQKEKININNILMEEKKNSLQINIQTNIRFADFNFASCLKVQLNSLALSTTLVTVCLLASE